jgi:hypothetical protein
MDAFKRALGNIRNFSPSRAGSNAYASIGKNTLIAMFAFLLVFCVVVGYAVYVLVNDHAIKVAYVNATKTGVQTGSAPNVISNAVTFDGTSGTVMFWAYINKLPINNPTLQLVSLGTPPLTSAANTSSQNNMMFTLSTVGSPSMKISMALAPGTSANTSESLLVPYVPTKRWVHFAVTADLLKGTIVAYGDGVQVIQGSITPTNFAFPSGSSLVIAGSPDMEAIISQVGYVSQVMTQAQIQREYYKGPIYSRYSFLGLSAYGLRSPIYSTDTSINN